MVLPLTVPGHLASFAMTQCTVGDLKDMACRALGIEEPQQWALWDYAGQKAGGSVSLGWLGPAAGTAAHGGQRS